MPSDDAGKLIARLALATILLPHGLWKLNNGLGFIEQSLAGAGLPIQLAYGVYLAEIVAPIMLLLGMWTRLAAATVAFDMCMAMFLVLRPNLLAIKPQGGGLAVELEGLILFVALALLVMGGGRYALTPDPKRPQPELAPLAPRPRTAVPVS
jgi:putative oxidoreductase